MSLFKTELIKPRTKLQTVYWFFRYRLIDLLSYGNLRYQIKFRFYGLFQRAFRGWAPVDTWGLDYHLAYILKDSLNHLADNTHGYPMGFGDKYGDKGAEEWEKWLRDKAEWFRWYYEKEEYYCKDYFTISEEEKQRRLKEEIEKSEVFYKEVLPDFVKYYGNLWD